MDIIYVSYNSQKWIDMCFGSLLKSDYDLKKVNVWIVDNASTDRTTESLKQFQSSHGASFGSFSILESEQNLGFGKANNLGFQNGKDEIACFFNIDTEVYPDTLRKLEEDISASEDEVGLWELRQFPYEHPKLYDPLTHEGTWSSGAAFAVRRSVFTQAGGFDEAIFMYAEDVDLSWRIRSFGYKLKYVPKAVITHYAYQKANEVKPAQHVNSVINNLLLRYRFGGPPTILKGHYRFLRCMSAPEAFPGSKKLLLLAYLKHFGKIAHFRKKSFLGPHKKGVAQFIGFDYSANRQGAFYENEFPDETPLVSVIVRTCGRPKVLRETLLSLRAQTYPNVEVVVVEDGEDCAGKMIREEFSDLNILYHATGEKVGRSKAGNTAMELAHGTYLNFLDDDDLFYADHIEVLVKTLERTKNRAAYAYAFETPVDVESRDPYIYKVHHYLEVYKTKFNRVELCYHNYIPIQCIMFEKSLFEEYGGLDESLDALEDWDLWVRYACHTDFDTVEKTTSVYRVPQKRDVSEKRQKELDDALLLVREKHKSYVQRVSAYDLAMAYEKQLN